MAPDLKFPKGITLSRQFVSITLCLLTTWCLAWSETTTTQDSYVQDIHILQDWRGDYPVDQLDKLPKKNCIGPIGYLDNLNQFADIWQLFKPGQAIPEIDFTTHIVIFARNTAFFNRIGIAKVIMRQGTAEILVMGTLSALPIEDRVGMAMAVIPRKGIFSIQAGNERLPLIRESGDLVPDPMNATYWIETCPITLQNGRAETNIIAGSAIKAKTTVVDKAVKGDLNGDGREDMIFFLVHHAGGSGSFYYIAAALNFDGGFKSTNTFLIGDRILPRDISIDTGVIIVRYLNRLPIEPFSAEPSVEAHRYLALNDGRLTALNPLKPGDQIVNGWVVIGHEIRSFKPCFQNSDYWISGGSPALSELTHLYQQTLPGSKPYTPLYMVLIGGFKGPPASGFGANFSAAFTVNQLVRVSLSGKCQP